MRLLLDTQVFLWVVAGSRELKAPARRLLDAADEIRVSAASIWEIAIKTRLGKLEADAAELAALIEPSGMQELPVTSTHAAGVARLESLHGDPFDRLLVAQAMAEPLRLVTADSFLARYTDLVVVV